MQLPHRPVSALYLVALSFLAVCLAAPAAAAPAAPAPAAPVQIGPPLPEPAPRSSSSTVTLHVVVSHKDGKPIGGLHQQDFVVQVNKHPVPISSFQGVEATAATAAPIQVILLVDTVNTRFSNVAYERQEIDRYLKQNGGKLAQPTSLVVLSDTSTFITPEPTRDGLALADTLDHAEIGLREIRRDTGFYGWTEQFQISTKALTRLTTYEASRPGRKLLLWVSPGWPLLSGPEVDLSSKDRKGLFNTLVGLSTAIRQAHITLSSIDPLGTEDALGYRTTFYEEFTKGVPDPSKMDIGNLALQVLALQSGGRVLNSSNDVARQITTAASDADAFYTLTIPSPPAEHPNEYRSISVIVEKPGLTAHTLTGYYAQP